MINESEEILKKLLIEEAEDKIRNRIKKGDEKSKAIKEVSKDMELTSDEEKTLDTIFNEPEKPLSTPDNPNPNSIYFDNSDDVNSAIGVLMYNNIPWESKSTENPYIQFDNQKSLEKAMVSLNKKWDFIDNKEDTVATISFDNINDYKKVLDFIVKSGMFISFDDDTKLDEDVSDRLESEDTNGRSFVAQPKKIKDKIDPTKNKDQRAVVVRKRFR